MRVGPGNVLGVTGAISIAVSFGGIKKLTKLTDLLVPVMTVIYVATVVVLILVNFTRISWFFYTVITEAFKPEAIFGGAFGIALVLGVKRGLITSEVVGVDVPVWDEKATR